ncbi:ATP-dependent (S)-NAD(P)H-hydrate dehydratase [Crateriforma conspicua]|uniref:ADP-dependent (S)-NAD(P)H-hydrate dehydratase n=1 Tax=Crateriforma conspicua TaxID=2527996 RepID=A0A5C6FQN1_9PLAN|nr:NAD(P)H-hydrate dehydratase [Crateriforma conspicua]TWU65179.1 ATP-dependent (S)-NAD(P)H-hydrate dehydratase [Crateriforma conspicua]
MNDPAPPLPPRPTRKTDAHKGDFGKCLLVGGSRGMAGSIALSTLATLRTGTGLVTAAVPDRCLETVAAFHPCLMTVPLDDHDGHFGDQAAKQLAGFLQDDATGGDIKFDAIGCGPGMSTGMGSQRVFDLLWNQTTKVPRVFDADALNILSAKGWLNPSQSADASPDPGPAVLTPHPGELQRLTGVSASDRQGQIDAAASIADRTGVVIVVKGGPTVVVGRAGRWTNTTGNPGMATAGCGDVLTGVITSLLGQRGDDGRRMSPWDAARLGVFLHGAAGDRAAERLGQAFMVATDVIDGLSDGPSDQ